MLMRAAGLQPYEISNAVVEGQKALIKYAKQQNPKFNAILDFSYVVHYFQDRKSEPYIKNTDVTVETFGTPAQVKTDEVGW